MGDFSWCEGEEKKLWAKILIAKSLIMKCKQNFINRFTRGKFIQVKIIE